MTAPADGIERDVNGDPIIPLSNRNIGQEIKDTLKSGPAQKMLKWTGPQAIVSGLSSPPPQTTWVAPDKEDPGDVGSQQANDSFKSTTSRLQNLRRPFNTARGDGASFRPESYSRASTGGDEIYEKTFKTDPAVSDAAQTDLANTKAQHASAVAEFYKGQSERDTATAAAMKQRAQEDQVNIAARQKKLDDATQFYTNDLADQGKFWTNPGNIVSAIAFSLMPIFSNDPAVGARLINQAIDRDMANRQHAAQGTLGALSSNLAGYHKIAGDRQAGDLLARAEAHRIAAQEIARIGAQFEGPLAQKQMAANIADQTQKRDLFQMEFHKHNNYIEAAREDARLTAARARGPGGFTPGIAHLGGHAEATGGPLNTAVTGGLGKTGIPSTAGGNMTPTTKALVKTGGLNGVAKGLSSGVIDADQAEEGARSWIYAQAVSLGIDPDKHQKAVWDDADKQVAPMADRMKLNSDSRVKISELQTRMKGIEGLMGAKDPNDFVSLAQKIGMPDVFLQKYATIMRSSPDAAKTRAAELEQAKMEAVAHFKQDFAGVINASRHELFGGALSTGEKSSFAAEIDLSMPWNDQKNYLAGRSRALQAYVDSQSAALTNPAARILWEVGSAGQTRGQFNELARPEVSKPGEPKLIGPQRLGPVER